MGQFCGKKRIKTPPGWQSSKACGRCGKRLWIWGFPACLAVLGDETGHQPVELGILLPAGGDLSDRVEGGRMVFVAEKASNLRQGEGGRLFQDLHRDLTGKDDLLLL